MSRRIFVTALALAIVAAPLAAETQQAAKTYRIGILTPVAVPQNPGPVFVALRQGLQELGYVEGQNLIVEYRAADGAPERYPQLVADFERLKVDVIVAISTPAALAAKEGTSTIPIVMLYVSDPVGMGLVSSLARPGGNVTGLSFAAADTYAKTLDLLKEVSPRISSVAALINPTNQAHVYLRRDNPVIRDTTRVLGLRLERIGVRTGADLESAFREVLRQRFDAMTVSVLNLAPPDVQRIVAFALKQRLPSIALRRDYVDAGLMMSLLPNFADHAHQGARFIDKLLKGAKPADLPVEQPTKFELVVNLKTAKALGLTIPQSVLIRADQVIE